MLLENSSVTKLINETEFCISTNTQFGAMLQLKINLYSDKPISYVVYFPGFAGRQHKKTFTLQNAAITFYNDLITCSEA